MIIMLKNIKRKDIMEKKDDRIEKGITTLDATIFTSNANGTLSLLLDKYIPSEAERKKNEYLKRMENDIEELKQKIDPSNLEKPEFYSIFSKLLKQSIDEYREEKITAFRNLTLNVAMTPYEFNKVDFYARLVIILIPDEIMILRLFYLLDVKGELKEYDNDPKERNTFYIIKKVYNIEDELYLHAIMTDITRYRLVLRSGELSTRFPRNGFFLSDLGKDFARYIFEPKEGDLYGFFTKQHIRKNNI